MKTCKICLEPKALDDFYRAAGARDGYRSDCKVCNLAARLCDTATDGQILVSKRIAGAVEGNVRLEEIGDLALKGLSQAVAVFNVVAET